MSITLLALYLKLNLLLIAAFGLWLATKQAARLLRFEVGPSLQLVIARRLFLLFTLAIPAAWAAIHYFPDLLKLTVGAIPRSVLAGGMTIYADFERGLGAGYTVGDMEIRLGYLLLAAILAGFAVQAGRFYHQLRQLKDLVETGVPWKSLRNVNLFFSDQTATPFSTKVLGRKDVVLPSRLLPSPSHLRIALKHELQHFRNGDLDWVLFVEAIKLLCFWNPAAYAWHNEFDCLQEFACDEALLKKHRVPAKNYGHCLLDVAAYRFERALPAASNMAPRFSPWSRPDSQLKKRILLLDRIHSRKLTGVKSLGYGVLFGAGILSAALVVFAQDIVNNSTSTETLPIKTLPAKYPKAALDLGLVGWVQLRFTVTAAGDVRDIHVVDSCVDGREYSITEGNCIVEYSDIFDETSIDALKKFKFEPRETEQPGVQYVFSYVLED